MDFRLDWPQGEWNCLTTALARARNESLTLDVDLDTKLTFSWLSLLEKVFPRVGTLYLTGLPARFMHDDGNNEFPKLRKLGLTVKFDLLDMERIPPHTARLDWNSVFWIIGSSVPLHELSLTLDSDGDVFSSENISLIDPAELPFSLEELTTLTLKGGSLIAMIPLLRACTALSTLSISGVDLDAPVLVPSDDSNILLPSLQSLSLSGLYSTIIPSHLQCPQLRHIVVSGCCPLPSVVLQGILSRSDCAVQTLDMQFDTAPPPDSEKIWRDTLPLLIHLKTFTLRLGNARVTAETLPLLTQPNVFPLLSSLIVHITDSLDGVLLDESRSASKPLERDGPAAEAALEDFFDACIYKAGGGVLPSLDVLFLFASYRHIDYPGLFDPNGPVRQQESRLLARMRRWKAEGVHVKAAHGCYCEY